jgi:hypothetical protein
MGALPTLLTYEVNAYFVTPVTNTGSPDTSYISYRLLIQGDSFSFFYVATSIRKISSNATGLDVIPLGFIKLLLPLILPVLTQLFNFILASSIFPVVWKISNVVPIPKVISLMERSDYRPISILPVLAKAFENVMFEQIAEYVTRNNLFSLVQSDNFCSCEGF